jgi:hypothetical protein
MPAGMSAINPIESRYSTSIDLSSERQHFVGVCAEFNVMYFHPALNLSRRVKALETPGDNVAVLIDLNSLQGTPGLVDVVRDNRPVARNVVGRLFLRLLGQCAVTYNG